MRSFQCFRLGKWRNTQKFCLYLKQFVHDCSAVLKRKCNEMLISFSSVLAFLANFKY